MSLARSAILALVFAAGTAPAQQLPTTGPLPPSPVPGLDYAADFFPGAKHDPAIPTPESILGFQTGQRAATHAQIQACLKAWAGASNRCALFEYARSYENRALSYLVITSPANLQRLDEIRAANARLADPRKLDAAEADRLTASAPAIAWMAYCIHGDEMSSSDAALAAAYHLIAGQDPDVTALLDQVVIIIDPLMNPDGRDRWLNQQFENRTVAPSLDDQSLLHTGFWPWGRTNHYLFDLNRDWILGIHPETRGRVRAIGQWNPQFLLESHEQEPQDTFLFSPPRAPFSPYLPRTLDKWYAAFSKDNAAAFDKLGWRYYTGEWNEGWYPGYSGSWAAYRGAIESLYEQARIQTDAVRRPEGTLDTYRESVHRQLVATFANLNTLRAHRAEILKDYLTQRRENVAEDGPFANRTFAIPPSANRARLDGLLDKLRLQGFELYTASADFTATGKDQLGRTVKDRIFPAGTILLPGRQPEARLLIQLLDFDLHMPEGFLNEERREILRFDRSRLYDVTAWNLTMLHGVEAFELAGPAPDTARPYAPTVARADQPGVSRPQAQVGWLIDGEDDRSVAAAARLMERGVQVRLALKPFELEGRPWPRGSVLITRIDNRAFTPRSAPPGPGEPATALGYTEVLARVCTELGLTAEGIDTGLSPGDLPDLGGEFFPLAQAPSIAVLAREPVDPNSYGEVWFTLDHELGIRASYLDAANVGAFDLRRYNVIILPPAGGDPLRDIGDNIKAWVRGGGTLIAIGPTAGGIASEKSGLSSVRLLPDVLGKLDDYDLAVQREWLARTTSVNADAVWSHTPSPEVAYPWPGGAPGEKAPEKLAEDELKRRDKWEARFMPQGVLLAGRTDDRSWLTFGAGPVLPILYTGGTVLMASDSVESPVRLGAIVPAPAPSPEPAKPDGPKADAAGKADDNDDQKEDAKGDAKEEPNAPPRLGWAATPAGYELRLRMSGLLWPEAARRLGHSAYLTRERLGDGQIILFSASPTWRGAARGTVRLFVNAAVYGPGLGASQPIRP